MPADDERTVETRAHTLMLVALTESGRRAEDLQDLLPRIYDEVLSLDPGGAGQVAAAELLCRIWRSVVGTPGYFNPAEDSEKWTQAADAASMLSVGDPVRVRPLLVADQEVAAYTLSLLINALASRMRAAIEWGSRGAAATKAFRSV